jgi:hypothetical protein
MTPQWAGTWGPYAAIDHRFSLRSTSVTLGSFLDTAYGALRTDGASGTWYGVDHDGRFGGRPSILADDDILYSATEPSELLPWLVWRVNRDVASTATDPLIHGAAVEMGGFVTVFVGRSGVGKSTLAAGLTLAGATYVTDEAVALTDKGLARPYPKPVALAHEAVARLGLRGGEPPGRFRRPTTERLVDARSCGSVAAQPAPVGAVVILERAAGAGGPPVLTPMRRAEALVEVARNRLNPAKLDVSALRSLAVAVDGASCARLTLGTRDATISAAFDLISATAREHWRAGWPH